jgi:multimeric flavodoxin WrbA
MSATVLGVSGSPVRDSNTDRAVRYILEQTGLAHEFVKLSELNMEPCRACLGCVKNNQCVVHDDAHVLAEKFRGARAFVLGGFTPYSSLDARTKMFMERMYCLRHQTGLNAGKIGVSVLTTACDPAHAQLPPAANIAGQQIAFWMMEEGMVNLGSLIILGNVPCIRCGHGDECPMTGVKMLHGPDATVASLGVNRFDTDTALRQQAAELGHKIRDALAAAPLPAV